ERSELASLAAEFEREGRIGPCTFCGGLLKLATISFGQPMPWQAMERAQKATLACDLFLAIGSSLQVHPAAGFPELAQQAGAKLAILNREATPLDDQADLVIHDEIGPTLDAVTPL
ncbi:NAD-dependent deacetylase, partial [Vibrio agarivorans]